MRHPCARAIRSFFEKISQRADSLAESGDSNLRYPFTFVSLKTIRKWPGFLSHLQTIKGAEMEIALCGKFRQPVHADRDLSLNCGTGARFRAHSRTKVSPSIFLEDPSMPFPPGSLGPPRARFRSPGCAACP